MALRPYTPETPFKAIAWSASARTGELMARQYEPTVSLDTALYLAVDSFDEKDRRSVRDGGQRHSVHRQP